MTADATPTLSRDPVKQFSVFTENRVGRLRDLAALFRRGNVHMMAMTVLDTSDSAIVRFIVDDPDKARELMIQHNLPHAESNMLAVEIADESDLQRILGALFEAEVNIHYVYSFIKRPGGRGAIAINVEDGEVASQALHHRGFTVLYQGDIAR